MHTLQQDHLPPSLSSYPSTTQARSSWIEINTVAFTQNIAQYRKLIGNTLLAPVIKSNAYGHGLELIATLCEKNPNVDWICVVNTQEALHLRRCGIQKPILVLSIVYAQDIQAAIQADIALVLYDWHMAQLINTQAALVGKKAIVHLKIDTGLSRLGFMWFDAIQTTKAIYELSHITVQGIFTHYADSENDDLGFCVMQLSRFNSLVESLQSIGINIPIRHTTCSAATTALSTTHHTLVRAGIGIYGLWPSVKNMEKTIKKHSWFSLQSVLSWKTNIIQIKTIPAGSSVGYDRTFTAPTDMTIAILPVGYWDGYDRRLSNKSHVLINNKRCPQLGRIAMNLMMIDITGVHTHVGDEVILLGNHDGVRANDLAALCNTINYEVVTRINPLLPRISV